MFFSEKQDLNRFSSSFLKLGFLMAGGDPDNLNAQKQIRVLNQTINKMSPEFRPIENMRIFQATTLSERQKLKIYELFLQTLGRAQIHHQRGFTFHFRNAPLPEKQKASLQVLEARAGAWVSFVISAGAMIAQPEGCSQKLLQFGVFLGRTLQVMKDLRTYHDQIRAQDRELCEHYEEAFEQAQRDLNFVLEKIRTDFHFPETSMAYQMTLDLGLSFMRPENLSLEN